MSKIDYFCFIILKLAFSAFGQVTPSVLNDLTDGNLYDGYTDMVLYNNMMYISNSDAGIIFKVDVSTPDADPVVVLSGLSLPTGVTVFAGNLFFFEAADAMLSPNSGKLWMLDLYSASATPNELYSGLSFPTEIEVVGFNAFAAENILVDGELDHGQISVIDFEMFVVKTVLYDQLHSLDDIELVGDDLYLLEWNESTDKTNILKMNIGGGTPGTPVVFYDDPQNYYPVRIEAANGKLYFNMDSNVNPSVFSLDLGSASPTATAVATPFSFNGQGAYLNELVVSFNNMLYAFGTTFDGDPHYLLYNANLNLLGNENHSMPALTAYPNPCTDVVHIAGIETPTPFSVCDLTGKRLIAGTTDSSVEVSALQSGVYVLSIDGVKAMKFVKQ